MPTNKPVFDLMESSNQPVDPKQVAKFGQRIKQDDNDTPNGPAEEAPKERIRKMDARMVELKAEADKPKRSTEKVAEQPIKEVRDVFEVDTKGYENLVVPPVPGDPFQKAAPVKREPASVIEMAPALASGSKFADQTQQKALHLLSGLESINGLWPVVQDIPRLPFQKPRPDHGVGNYHLEPTHLINSVILGKVSGLPKEAQTIINNILPPNSNMEQKLAFLRKNPGSGPNNIYTKLHDWMRGHLATVNPLSEELFITDNLAQTGDPRLAILHWNSPTVVKSVMRENGFTAEMLANDPHLAHVAVNLVAKRVAGRRTAAEATMADRIVNMNDKLGKGHPLSRALASMPKERVTVPRSPEDSYLGARARADDLDKLREAGYPESEVEKIGDLQQYFAMDPTAGQVVADRINQVQALKGPGGNFAPTKIGDGVPFIGPAINFASDLLQEIADPGTWLEFIGGGAMAVNAGGKVVNKTAQAIGKATTGKAATQKPTFNPTTPSVGSPPPKVPHGTGPGNPNLPPPPAQGLFYADQEIQKALGFFRQGKKNLEMSEEGLENIVKGFAQNKIINLGRLMNSKDEAIDPELAPILGSLRAAVHKMTTKLNALGDDVLRDPTDQIAGQAYKDQLLELRKIASVLANANLIVAQTERFSRNLSLEARTALEVFESINVEGNVHYVAVTMAALQTEKRQLKLLDDLTTPGVFKSHILMIYINNLISSLGTAGWNVASVASMSTVRVLERKIAHMYDPEAIAPQEATALATGMWRAWIDFARGDQRLKDIVGVEKDRLFEVFAEGSDKFQLRKSLSAKGWGLDKDSIIGTAVDWTGHLFNAPVALVGSVDMIARVMIMNGMAHSLAVREAHKIASSQAKMFGKVTEGKEFNKLVDEIKERIMKNPESEFQVDGKFMKISEASMNEANLLSLAQPLKSELGRAFDKALSHGWGRLMIPFWRVTALSFREGIERNPFLGRLVPSVVQDLNAGGARQAIAKAKFATGYMFALTTTGLMSAGLITNKGPNNKELNDIFRDTEKPYTVMFSKIHPSLPDLPFDKLGGIGPLMQYYTNVAYLLPRLAENPMSGELAQEMIVAHTSMLANPFMAADYKRLINALTGDDIEATRKFIEQRLDSAVPIPLSQSAKDLVEYVEGQQKDPRSLVKRGYEYISGTGDPNGATGSRNWWGDIDEVPNDGPIDFIMGVLGILPNRYAEDGVERTTGRTWIKHEISPPPWSHSFRGTAMFPSEINLHKERTSMILLSDPTIQDGASLTLKGALSAVTASWKQGDGMTDGEEGSRDNQIGRIVAAYRAAAAEELKDEAILLLQEDYGDSGLTREPGSKLQGRLKHSWADLIQRAALTGEFRTRTDAEGAAENLERMGDIGIGGLR